jgi:drug/metabolite transporter (DMT)-like permease
MSSLGPPPPRKRRLWLWIILGLILLCVIACAILFYWIGFTDSGQEFLDNVEATATAQARD